MAILRPPNAMRVSVVGDFNLGDGRRLPMRRLWDSGIFELFVPGLAAGQLYKYEIKAKGGLTFLKADPYANAAQSMPCLGCRRKMHFSVHCPPGSVIAAPAWSLMCRNVQKVSQNGLPGL